MPDYLIESKILESINDNINVHVCGIDEVGRGPLAGPVLACALVLQNTNDDWLKDVNDSKKLSKSKRQVLFNKIIQNSFYGIGMASVEEIESINILQATKLAMQRAYEKLMNICIPVAVIIDGRDKINLDKHNLNSERVFNVIKGDQKSITIACASIVAKEIRDKIMCDLSLEDSNSFYRWDKNAGYGTKLHIEMIKKHGISKHHRKGFYPIKEMINT